LALTERQKLTLEERTALLFNLAGVHIQKVRSSSAVGVSSRRLYKVLANCIWDCHWLSHDHPAEFPFRGVGDLVWIPHRFGALGQVIPQLEYENLTLEHGLFANVFDLV
jgi:hypothetical protein